MVRKQTSPRVSAIAAQVLRQSNPLDTAEGRQMAREAIADAGLPFNDRAMNALIDRIADIFEPFFAEAKSAAGSALAQDEGGSHEA